MQGYNSKLRAVITTTNPHSLSSPSSVLTATAELIPKFHGVFLCYEYALLNVDLLNEATLSFVRPS